MCLGRSGSHQNSPDRARSCFCLMCGSFVSEELRQRTETHFETHSSGSQCFPFISLLSPIVSRDGFSDVWCDRSIGAFKVCFERLKPILSCSQHGYIVPSLQSFRSIGWVHPSCQVNLFRNPRSTRQNARVQQNDLLSTLNFCSEGSHPLHCVLLLVRLSRNRCGRITHFMPPTELSDHTRAVSECI